MDESWFTILRDPIDRDTARKLRLFVEALQEGHEVQRAARDAGLDTATAERFLEDIKRYLEKKLKSSKGAPGRKAVGNAGPLTAYADGASRGNPGQAACAVIISDESGDELLRRAKRLGVATNNVAEYEGVLLALELAASLGTAHLTIRLDSELVVQQLNGRYKVKHPSLKPLFERARMLMGGFETVEIEHVGRADTKAVDKLANETLDGKS